MDRKENNVDGVFSLFLILLVIAIVIFVISYCIGLPEILFAKYTIDESGKRVIDNTHNVDGEFAKFILLVIGGLGAIWGIWINNNRVKVMNEQIKLQTKQVDIATEAQKNVAKQIEIAEKGQETVIAQIQIAKNAQINTRFKDAAQLLSSENTSSNLSGIYALNQIAVEIHNSGDEEYKGYIKIIHDILCAFIRENSIPDKEDEEGNIVEPAHRTKPDIVFQTIIDLLFKNHCAVYDSLSVDLHGAYLSLLDFFKANLSEVNLFGAILSEANLSGSNLSQADLFGADLFGADLFGANLREADLRGAILYGAVLYEAVLYEADLTDAKLYKTDFTEAIMDENTDFCGTLLAGYSIEEITKPGRSRELTTPKEEENEE